MEMRATLGKEYRISENLLKHWESMFWLCLTEVIHIVMVIHMKKVYKKMLML